MKEASLRPVDMPEKSILVVAHPDDEALWFSSILDKVDEVLVCFLEFKPLPKLGLGRKKSLQEHPLKNITCLGVPESGVFNDANWTTPEAGPYGMVVEANRQAVETYKDNFSRLKEELYRKIEPFDYVFTHNPWGEYGHEEHVQVNRVVRSLQEELAFDIWHTTYFSNKSVGLMLDNLPQQPSDMVTCEAQVELAEELKRLYQKHGCWTWYQDWQWFQNETIFRDPGNIQTCSELNQTLPLQMVRVEVSKHPEYKDKPSRLEKVLKKFNLR